MLFGPHSPFSVSVKDTVVFTNVPNFFVPGSTESIFEGPKFKSHVLAVSLSAC